MIALRLVGSLEKPITESAYRHGHEGLARKYPISAEGSRPPRGFDMETALDTGQRLFHAGSYETVGLAALTDALGVKLPSFTKRLVASPSFSHRSSSATRNRPSRWTRSCCPGGRRRMHWRNCWRAPREPMREIRNSGGALYSKQPEAMTEMTASSTHAEWQISAVIEFANLSPAPIRSAHRRLPT